MMKWKQFTVSALVAGILIFLAPAQMMRVAAEEAPEDAITVEDAAEPSEPEDATTVEDAAEPSEPEEAITVDDTAESSEPEDAITVDDTAEQSAPEEEETATENREEPIVAGYTAAQLAASAVVTVYADYNHEGIYQDFTEGRYDMDTLENGVGNDSISSIRVADGYVVTIFIDQAFSGESRVLTQSYTNLREINLDDRISSFVVSAKSSDTVVSVYDNSDYQGTVQNFATGDYDVETLWQGVGNDKISSVRVEPGYRVILYGNYRFGGDSRVITQDITNLKSMGFNDETSSIRIEPLPAEPVVTIYSDAVYGGVSQQLSVGEYDDYLLKQGIGNDSLSSIRVKQGYKVTLYTNRQFSGSALELTQDRVFVNGTFHDSVSSLRIEAVNPLDDTCIDISDLDDNRKAELMKAFAPRIWMAQGEEYMPSTVEFALDHTTRTQMPGSNTYWYVTKEALNGPEAKLDYFKGDLAGASAYAFWVEKDYNNIDISYFQFSPYNLGKTVIGSEFGNHVGDWEHVTVRFARFTHEGREYLKPIQVLLPAHSFTNTYDWADMEKTGGTHTVVYCALNSHGMWKDAGDHVYQNIVVAQLTDICNQGTAWDTWNCLRNFEYDARSHSGRGIGGETWPTYFNNDYSNPDSLSAECWGNPEEGSLFGQPLLANGPTGPEAKDALRDYVVLN